MNKKIIELAEKGRTRFEMCEELGITDRELRRIIADELPEIGQSGNGYYVCKTTDDYARHEAHLWSRVKALMKRIRRVRERRLDLQHCRKVSDMVRSWIVVDSDYNEVVR